MTPPSSHYADEFSKNATERGWQRGLRDEEKMKRKEKKIEKKEDGDSPEVSSAVRLWCIDIDCVGQLYIKDA